MLHNNEFNFVEQQRSLNLELVSKMLEYLLLEFESVVLLKDHTRLPPLTCKNGGRALPDV